MKRVSLILASVCLLIMTSGCGGKEKRLECTYKMEQEGVTAKQVFTLNFDKKDKYKSGSLKQDNILSEEALKSADLSTYKSNIQKSVLDKQFKDMKYNITDNGKDTVTFDISISKENMESITGTKNISGSDSAKKSFEKSGYTCKMN